MSKQSQEGVMIMLVIVAVGSTILGVIQNNMTLMFGGVAIILLDTVLLLDYNRHFPNGKQIQTEVNSK